MKLIYEEAGICTPFVDPKTERLWFGRHKGKVISSINLDGTDLRDEVHIEQTPCHNHISSPAIYGDILYYHGVCPGGSRQRTYLAAWDKSGTLNFYDDEIAFPYFIQYGPTQALAKYKGVIYYHLENGKWKQYDHLRGRYRHCYPYGKHLYYSRIGDEPERICRAEFTDGYRIALETEETVVAPLTEWGATKRSVIGPAKHRCECRDPHIYRGVLYFIGRGERGIYATSLPSRDT